MRLFFCVELAEEVKRALAEVARVCRTALGDGSWVLPENYHLTVRFLGEVAEARLPQLLEAGKRAAAETQPFTLTLDLLGGFPEPRAARVLWVGSRAEPPEFQKLSWRVEEAVRALGFPPEKKGPVAHITLARFKSPKDLRPLLARVVPNVPEAKLAELTLMRSELRPEGAKYTPLASWTFGG
ncbi:MAG: RNA 2',3'-cyclic phosphodiesterase [Candidatus Bipolaricaulota bacterium]|nr:RNA 2',3'-cyclic phosphodiesterase [Candidatus Bipolaricaulota bacterium]MDW8127387.1 RNA 2',3'-cyclic phosphodiesterase [Candidatus Bipolaricaulota bacterium]